LGITDAAGYFRIDYNSSDFELTPFSPAINLEWVGGPDLYFTAKLGSTAILQEDRAVGRTTGRQNVGPCFCVNLCSDKVIGPPPAPTLEQSMGVQRYSRRRSGGFAVLDSGLRRRSNVILRLRRLELPRRCTASGQLPSFEIAAPANALQYRFVIGEYDWSPSGDNPNAMPSVAPTVFNPITQIRPTTVGYVYYTDANGIYGPGDVVITSGDRHRWLPRRSPGQPTERLIFGSS
jgi:hypothetical protein